MIGEPVNKKPLTNRFIPNLQGKRVTIRLVSGGQPITGTIESYNTYDLVALDHHVHFEEVEN